MKTVRETLLIINNCPKYTPRIKAHVAAMADYALALRAPRVQNSNRIPTGVRSELMKKCWLSDVGALDFSFGEWEYPRLKDLITGCLRHNAEHSEHRFNVEHVALHLINSVEV